MIISGEYKCKHSIILTPSIIHELDAVMASEENHNTYSVGLKNKSTIKFDNLDELLSYENFSDQQIVSLAINAYYSDKRLTIDPGISFFWSFSHSASIEYWLNSPQDEIILREKLKTIFKKAKTPNAFIYKFDLYLVFLVLFVLSGIYEFVRFFSNNPMSSQSNHSLAFYFIPGLVGVLLLYSFKFVWNKLFPPVTFCWGEVVKTFKRSSDIRRNIFWGVIITTLTTIVLSFIL